MTLTTTSGALRGTATQTSGCGCGCSSCTICDSLQCLCRPRFFAGQLITDADFRRLDQYLVGKSRLHNKYLHGTGVVCGLEVVCNPCDDTVTVRPGYALGPCGEDIVVCSATSVPVGQLIRDQRRAAARVNCGDPYANPPADCDALEQRWILGICYDEQPAKPVTTLTTSTPSGGCGCGGSSPTTTSAGCGCGGTSTTTRPTGCEPTVICEGFRFTLTKEPPTVKPRGQQAATHGALAAHVKQCLTMLEANVTAVPTDPTTAELITYCCQLKADLRTIIASSTIHDCTLGQRLSAIVCPSANDENAVELARQSIADLLMIAIDLFRECVCAALLPPCPDDCADECVPIATLTVRSSDLTVLDVCNWSSRTFAVTMPMLGYWLGWLPLGSTLRALVSRLCCPPSIQRTFSLGDRLAVEPDLAAAKIAPEQRARAAEPHAPAPPPVSSLAALLPEQLKIAGRYVTDPSPLSGLEATVLSSLGMTGPDGQALADDAELAAPLTSLALSRLLGSPGLDLGAPLRQVNDVVAPRLAEPPADDRLAELEKALSSLQSTVRTQASTITDLRNRIGDVPREAAAPAKKAAKKGAEKAAKKTEPTKRTPSGRDEQ
jgi:hypothetical protein